MPTAPKKRNRPWVTKRKPFERELDNSWFYNNWKWRKFSSAFKKRNALCVKCKNEGIITAATVTDHLQQFGVGVPGWDLNNLNDKDFQPLCDSCHNSRSGKQGSKTKK